MQPVALRRISRRTQPDRVSLGLLHTSASAESSGGIQISAEYLNTLNGSTRLAETELEIWAGSTLSKAQQARDIKTEKRREDADEARQRTEQRRRDEEYVLVRRETERRVRAAAREEIFRQELERIRQQREQAERQRLEAEEARRRATEEEHRREQERIRLEREQAEQQRRAAEEAHRRAAEEDHRRERDHAERQQRAAEETQRRENEEAERRRRERLRPCVICMDENDFSTLAELPCRHWSCRDCLRGGFEASYAARSRFQCCQQYVPITILADVLSNEFVARYELMVLEQTTPNPTYCANPACASFIPSTNYHGPDAARCNCGTETCRHCRTASHAGRGCIADTATEQVRALAAVVGWKTCPACGTMVERRDGCLHMSCRCGAEFCYRCAGYWRDCESRCAGRYF